MTTASSSLAIFHDRLYIDVSWLPANDAAIKADIIPADRGAAGAAPRTGDAEAEPTANAANYGLNRHFYTKGSGFTYRVSAALEYRIIGTNKALLASDVAPFGSGKSRGTGRLQIWHG